MDRGLNSFGPCNRTELDVPVDVPHSEDTLPARFEVRIDHDAAVFVQPQLKTLEGILGRKKTNLDYGERAVDLKSARYGKPDLISSEFRSLDLRRHMYGRSRLTYARERVRLTHRHFLANDESHPSVPSH